MSNNPSITLYCNAVRVRAGWIGQVLRSGEIVWESDQHYRDAKHAEDAAFKEADRAVSTLTNQGRVR